jgi:hypothetical protein
MKKVIGILIALSLISISNALPTDQGPKTITVKEKWTKVVDTKGLYLFSDTNDNVYSIQDTYWHWDFSSADRYAKIVEGRSYQIWLFGVRIPFLSMYENAYRIE